MRPEDAFKHRLVGHMRALAWHVSIVETGDTCPGFPDLEWCTPKGVSGLTECKIIRGRKMKFERFQVPWHLKRALVNGDATILAFEPRSERVYVYRSRDIRDLLEKGTMHPPLAIHTEGGALLRTIAAVARANVGFEE